jgi:cytohesin
MELADFTLDTYIQYLFGNAIGPTDIDGVQLNSGYVSRDCAALQKMVNYWTIGTHIARGLEFLHDPVRRYAHRDLKPRNGTISIYSALTRVLYCRRDDLWKLADFGISSKTVTSALSTQLQRGTQGYRAPELLCEKPRYTIEVDIWALGCIMYELATGNHLFQNDYAVLWYSEVPDKALESVPSGSKFWTHHICENLRHLLRKDWKERPSASHICRLFSSYCQLLGLSTAQTLLDDRLYPLYPEWKELMETYPDEPEFLVPLADWYQSKGANDAVILLFHALVDKYPTQREFQERLAEAHEKIGNWDAAIVSWTNLVDENSLEEQLLDKLATACQTKGDGRITSRVWKELADKHPENTHLAKRAAELKVSPEYDKALLSAAEIGDLDEVHRILDKGADIEAKDDHGRTPVSWAAERGHAEAVGVLLKAGADIEAKDGYGRTPVSWAAERGHAEAMGVLLKAGADIEAKDDYFGRTPVSWAAERGHAEAVGVLRNRGSS